MKREGFSVSITAKHGIVQAIINVEDTAPTVITMTTEEALELASKLMIIVKEMLTGVR